MEANKELASTSEQAPTPIDVLKRARYEDITRLILQGHVKPKTLALAVGLSTRQLQRVLREPEFIEIFDQASGDLMANVDEVIKDEKASFSVRSNALHRRALTLMGKIQDAVSAELDHAIEQGKPWAVRSTMVKAGIEASVAMIDRDTTDLEPRHGGSKHLHLHITQHDADVLRDTMADVADDVDITDIISGGKIVEAEIVETEEDPGE